MNSARFRLLLPGLTLLLSLAASGLGGPARAAENRWEPAGPFGGAISALTAAPSDRRIVYAGTAEGLIFRSSDAGTSWTSVTGDFPAAGVADIAVDPGDPQTAYAAICLVLVEFSYQEGGIFKTVDGGLSWRLVTEEGAECEVHELAVDPHRPARVFAATREGLRVSEDRGATWQDSPGLAGNGIVTSVVLGKTPGTVFAAHNQHGVLKSVDGGATWTPGNAGLPAERWRIFGLAISPVIAFPQEVLYARVFGNAPGDTVFRSLDGETWTPAGNGLGGRQVHDLAVARAGTGVYAATDAGIFRTANGGVTWDPPSPGRESLPTRVLATPVLPHGVFYAGHWTEGISKRSESVWREANNGLNGVPVYNLAIAPADGSVRYATPDGRVLRSLDGGATWLPNGRGLAGLPFAFAIHPRLPRVALAGGFQGGIWKTTNAGASWRRVNPEKTACMDVLDIEFDPRTPSTVYAAGRFSSCSLFPDFCLGFKSTDAGETWSCMEGLPPQGVLSLALASSAPGAPATLYAGTEAFTPHKPVLKSVDGGRSWRPRSGGLPQRPIYSVTVTPQDARTVYAISQSGLFKSGDGGASWSPVGTGLPASTLGSLVVSPANPSHLFVLSTRFEGAANGLSTHVFRSVDGGASWTPVSREGLPDGALHVLRVSPAEPRTLYVTTRFGIFKLTLTE